VPTVAETLALAVQYHQAGDLAQAEHLYRHILTVDPNHATALHLLGVVEHQRGKNDRAVEHIARALRLKPDYAEAHSNLGVVLKDLGRLDEAVASHREALRYRPDYADAHNNLGVALRELGRLDEAVLCYRQALRFQPDDPVVLNNLSIALQEQGRLGEAIACYRESLRLSPSYAEAHSNLAGALREQGHLAEAIASYRQALSCKPDSAAVHNNLGIALQEAGRLAEAVAHFRQAVHLQPEFADAHNSLGVTLVEQGQVAEAEASYRQALRYRPDHAAAHRNLGMALLLLGRFAEGWPEYEWRRRCPEFRLPLFPQPWWDGSDLGGKTILLSAEQGLGDTLQFIRYAALVKERGARVIVGCPKPLARLLATCPGVDRVVTSGAELPPFDVQAPILSLPGLFQTTPATIPAPVPYLSADAASVERWRREVGSGREFQVAIAWQGNPTNVDRQRAVPLVQFAPLARVAGVRLIGLQKDYGREQLPPLAARLGLLDLGCRVDDFLDTAAVLANVDLVITVDTALAHLAGTLGVPVWVALRSAADWRWLRQREDSPWYPTMRLFRQTEPENWEEVFARIARELADLAAVRGR